MKKYNKAIGESWPETLILDIGHFSGSKRGASGTPASGEKPDWRFQLFLLTVGWSTEKKKQKFLYQAPNAVATTDYINNWR